MLDGLEKPVVPFLHEVLEPDAATHELAGDRDDQAQVVDDELLLRALVALAGAPSDLELRLPIERGMGPDQLDQRRKVIELAAVAHLSPILPFPLCCLERPNPPNDPDPWTAFGWPLFLDEFFDAQRPVLLLISARGVMTHRSLSDAALASPATARKRCGLPHSTNSSRPSGGGSRPPLPPPPARKRSGGRRSSREGAPCSSPRRVRARRSLPF